MILGSHSRFILRRVAQARHVTLSGQRIKAPLRPKPLDLITIRDCKQLKSSSSKSPPFGAFAI